MSNLDLPNSNDEKPQLSMVEKDSLFFLGMSALETLMSTRNEIFIGMVIENSIKKLLLKKNGNQKNLKKNVTNNDAESQVH